MKKNIIFFIIIILIMILLLGFILINKTYKRIDLTNENETVKENSQEKNNSNNLVFNIKQENLDDNDYYLFENYSNSSDILDSTKTIYINDIQIKLEDKKIKVIANDTVLEAFDDINFIVSDVNSLSCDKCYLYIFGIKKDGTVVKLEIGLNDISYDDSKTYEENYMQVTQEKLDFDDINEYYNFNDLKYIIGYKQDSITNIFNQTTNIFLFLDINGKYYIDRKT